MTLDTTVRTPGPVNIEELRMYCGLQLGGVDLWTRELSDVLTDHILLTPVDRCVGGAHLSILYVPVSDTEGRSVEVGWCTGWYSRSPLNEMPTTFHRRLSCELAAWLRERGLIAEVSCAAAQ